MNSTSTLFFWCCSCVMVYVVLISSPHSREMTSALYNDVMLYTLLIAMVLAVILFSYTEATVIYTSSFVPALVFVRLCLWQYMFLSLIVA